MSTPQFVDISSFQGSIDFAAYAAWARQWDKKARLAMKATEGTGFVDPLFATNRAKALEAGIDEIYYYHFARPDLGNSAIAEANFMQSIVGAIRNSDMIILDYEVSSPLATADWALGWLVEFGPKYGKLPGIYASSAYIEAKLQWPGLDAFPLWLANWQYTPDERPPVPAPWTSYEFVQYSDKASIPGVPGLVDADIYLGNIGENTSMTIDLTNPKVAQYFAATGDPAIWKCKTTGFLLAHGVLGFYQKFGGSGLNGLTHLGLPTSGEISAGNGRVYQRFERGVVAYDTGHTIDSPPEAGDCYLMHIDSGLGQDPRIAQLQAQITTLQSQVTALKTLPASANLQAINGLVAQASTAIAQAGIIIAKIGPLSQVQ